MMNIKILSSIAPPQLSPAFLGGKLTNRRKDISAKKTAIARRN
jgi:hypothetical protein